MGPDALVSDQMKETLDLCVQARRRECPVGVDVSRMKIEFLHHWHARHGIPAKSRLTAFLPRYAPIASKLAPLINLRNSARPLAALAEKLTGMSARRKLPAWRRDVYRAPPEKRAGTQVLLFVYCFRR